MKPRHTFRGAVIRGTARTAAIARSTQRGASSGGTSPARVVVARQVAGRGGKAVSVISGLPLGEAGLAELATRLKKLCGAGGSVKGGVIEIQGEHRERLVAELSKLGYAAKRAGG
jgi:translation initiation factor 1